MNEKITLQNKTDIPNVPVDQDPDVRQFLGLDRSPKAESSYENITAFTKEFEDAAGLNSVSDRARVRNESATGRRPMNVAKKALVGAGVVAGAAVYGLIGGQDLKHEQDLAKYDEANKAANIANNPNLFGEDLPEDPKDMTVQVDSQADTSGAPEKHAAPYTVGTDPGIDTAWEMAESIKDKVNATPGEAPIGDIRPLVDNIVEQSNADGQPGLQVGEQIMVPEVADRHEDPGIQLSSK